MHKIMFHCKRLQGDSVGPISPSLSQR